jgi:hypothetical protein
MDIKQRESLILQADLAYISLMGQLDSLLECASFYLQRYPSSGSPSDELVTKQLVSVVSELGALPGQLGDVIRRWKAGEERVLSVLGTEVHILNELWANVAALMYFCISHHIDTHPFVFEQAKADWTTLKRVNRLIP